MDWGAVLNNTAGWLISPTTIAYAIAAVGLAVHFGYGGLLNFGMAGFMALGAYGYAISILSFGLPWWVGIIVGMLAAAAVVGSPSTTPTFAPAAKTFVVDPVAAPMFSERVCVAFMASAAEMPDTASSSWT